MQAAELLISRRFRSQNAPVSRWPAPWGRLTKRIIKHVKSVEMSKIDAQTSAHGRERCKFGNAKLPRQRDEPDTKKSCVGSSLARCRTGYGSMRSLEVITTEFTRARKGVRNERTVGRRCAAPDCAVVLTSCPPVYAI